jgi:hypothetical protein
MLKELLLLTRVWQKWRFSAPQTRLWLIKVWFSASTFVVKIATLPSPKPLPAIFMDTLQLQREKFKTWFDTTIVKQFQLRQELVGQTFEGIFYTSKVEGWDIELDGSGAIHIPL